MEYTRSCQTSNSCSIHAISRRPCYLAPYIATAGWADSHLQLMIVNGRVFCFNFHLFARLLSQSREIGKNNNRKHNDTNYLAFCSGPPSERLMIRYCGVWYFRRISWRPAASSIYPCTPGTRRFRKKCKEILRLSATSHDFFVFSKKLLLYSIFNI